MLLGLLVILSQLFLFKLFFDALLEEFHHQGLDFVLDQLVSVDLDVREDTLEALESCLSHYDDLGNVQSLLLPKGEEEHQEVDLVFNHIILRLQALSRSLDGGLLIDLRVYAALIFLALDVTLLAEIGY